MKTFSLPEGMVITAKRHVGGKNNHKMKILHGFLRSVHDTYLHASVARNSRSNYTVVLVDTDHSFQCGGCYGWKEHTCELVMN